MVQQRNHPESALASVPIRRDLFAIGRVLWATNPADGLVLNQRLLLTCFRIEDIEIPIPRPLVKDVVAGRPCDPETRTQLSLRQLASVRAIRIDKPDFVS